MGALATVLTAFRAGASIFLEFAKTWVGAFVIAFCVAWFWSGHRHDAACAERDRAAEAERVRLGLIEHSRRETAIAEARDAALKDISRLTSERDDLEAKLKEADNASHVNDARSCLDARSVRRLKKF